MRFASRRIATALVLAGCSLLTVAAELQLPTDTEIQRLLADRIDVQKQSIGMVVGIVTPAGRRIVSYGKVASDRPEVPDGDTIFDIASVTKVFTALVLSDMVARGEVSLDDPVNKYLPDAVRVPGRNGREITLVDLATHTSSLPTWPADLSPFTAEAFATYSTSQLYNTAARVELPRDIGSRWEYSNFGYALLAHALSRRAGTDYETLVRKRVLSPLQMKSTGIVLPSSLDAQRSAGHAPDLTPAPPWTFGAYDGAGALKSTADDLLRFLDAAMNPPDAAWRAAFAALLEVKRPGRGFTQALGWQIHTIDGRPLILHDGAGLSYAASIAYDPEARVGVVVLSNASPVVGDIARHVLRSNHRLSRGAPVKPHQEIALRREQLGRYVGDYRTPSGMTFIVKPHDDFLTFRTPFSPDLRLRAASEREFFVRELGFEIEFTTAENGDVTALKFSATGTPPATAERVVSK